jgi:hypothetical protein
MFAITSAAIILVAGIAVAKVIFVPRPTADLGALSARWMAQHRTDAP